MEPTTEQLRISIERSALVTELRVNLWSELCWYAAEEKWQQGWERKAIDCLTKPERDWIMNLQYLSMEDWLDEFTEFK